MAEWLVEICSQVCDQPLTQRVPTTRKISRACVSQQNPKRGSLLSLPFQLATAQYHAFVGMWLGR